MRMYGGIISNAIQVYGTIRRKAPIEDYQRSIEFITARKSKWGLRFWVTDYVGPKQASQDVDPSQSHGMVMVP